MLAAIAFAPCVASAQDKGTVHPRSLPPLENPDDPSTPAKALFGRKTQPSAQQAKVVGFYAKGCLAGGESVPYDGEAWQVMRISRNRNWGHPAMVKFLQRMAVKLRREGTWPGFLVGDISQPRGGPMFTGHASHQIGLDADVWMTPMPDRTLSRNEREELSSTNVVREDKLDVNGSWTRAHHNMIKAVASEPQVQRIFVNAAIKKALCREATGDRTWLNKVRPMYEHNYHFHIRLACPAGEEGCQAQDPVPPGDGCDAGSLSYWFKDSVLHPKPNPFAKPKPPMTMAALPGECRAVLTAR
jgi:penicillin-insensitive murein endopeptidase